MSSFPNHNVNRNGRVVARVVVPENVMASYQNMRSFFIKDKPIVSTN